MNTMLKAILITFAATMLGTIIIFQNMSMKQIWLQCIFAVAWLTVYVYCEHIEIGVTKTNETQ